MTEELEVYSAGLFDGEGSVGVYRKKRGKYIRHDLHVGIKMTDINPLQYLRAYFGGSISFPRVSGNRKKQYAWQLTATKAVNFLEKIYPYLKVKQPGAVLAIQFYRNLVSSSNKLKKLSQEMIKARDIIANEFKILNKRGK
jgi:hypothetical protein